MKLIFKEDGHKYEDLEASDKKDWTSVTTLLKFFYHPFDQVEISKKSSKNKKGKWFGIEPDKIIELWNKESKRATDLGSWYHLKREKKLESEKFVMRDGIKLPIIPSLMEKDFKVAPSQKVEQGVYLEHFVYLRSSYICGQADRVEIVGDTVNIYDYKTNKELKEAYVDWEGVTKTLLHPLNNIEDSDLNKYALQLSIYMYMILKHNHHLKPGKLQIEHIIFEKEGDDEYGFPITKYDENGEPIVKEIKPYDLPYLKDSVISMINYKKSHPKKFLKK